MKPVFEEPIVEVIELDDKDIICTSGCGFIGYEIEDVDPIF